MVLRIYDAPHVPLRVKSSKALLHAIEQNFGTLARRPRKLKT